MLDASPIMKKAQMPKRWGDATLAIHKGQEKFHIGAPVGTTVARTANFTFESTEEMKRWAEGKSSAYIYTRYGNPTLTIAEEKLAVLKTGDEVISTRQTYGGTYRLMRDNFPRFGIVVRYVESDLAGLEQLVNPRTKALYIETPTNPTLRLVNLENAIAFAKEWGLIALIDNTFASPVLQKPIQLGFNVVLHSATKYLSGHSDLIAGAAAGSRAIIDEVRHNIINLGGSMDPEAAYLLIRGMKTLELRMLHQCKTAMIVAKYLVKHPKVSRVHYPGLPSHPDHKLARRQMKGFGAMLAFDLKGGLPAARRFCDRVRIFLLAASLGAAESLVVLPKYTSHYNMSVPELRGAGVEPGTVRVSVGLEDPSDLIEDLRQALR